MASEERRKSDEKIEEMHKLLTDMRITQIEMKSFQEKFIEPTLKKYEDTLYSKGGVCETIHEHTGEIKEIKNRVDRFPTIIGWVLGGISIGAGALLWIYETVQKVGGAK